MQAVCKCNCKNRGLNSYDQCQPDEPYVSFPPVRQPNECSSNNGPSGGSAGGNSEKFDYEPVAVPFNPPKEDIYEPEIELVPTAQYDTLEAEETFESDESSEDDSWGDSWDEDDSDSDWDSEYQRDEAANNPLNVNLLSDMGTNDR